MFLPSRCLDGFQPKFCHRCNMGTFIYWWGQSLHIKVKGHLRLSCKIGWKCKSGLIWKVEVQLEPNLVYWYHMEGENLLTIKGHIPRSKIIWGQVVRWTENVKFTSFERLKSEWNQTWFIYIIRKPLYVHMVKGHIPRSKIIWGQSLR